MESVVVALRCSDFHFVGRGQEIVTHHPPTHPPTRAHAVTRTTTIRFHYIAISSRLSATTHIPTQVHTVTNNLTITFHYIAGSSSLSPAMYPPGRVGSPATQRSHVIILQVSEIVTHHPPTCTQPQIGAHRFIRTPDVTK